MITKLLIVIFVILKTTFSQYNFGYESPRASNGNFQNFFPFQRFSPNGNFYQFQSPYQNQLPWQQNNNYYRSQPINDHNRRQQPQGSSINLIGNMVRNVGSSNGQNIVNSVVSPSRSNRNNGLTVSLSSVGNRIQSFGNGRTVANSVVIDGDDSHGNIINSFVGAPSGRSNVNLIGNRVDTVNTGSENFSQFFPWFFG